MITEVKDIDKNQALCKVIDMPETYVDINDILGIPLNQYRLRLLGFKQIDKIHALRPGAPNFNGTVYEAQINGIKIQIIEDNNSYELCRSTSAPTLPINYVHDMQHNITVNGKPLKINYMIFCPDRK